MHIHRRMAGWQKDNVNLLFVLFFVLFFLFSVQTCVFCYSLLFVISPFLFSPVHHLPVQLLLLLFFVAAFLGIPLADSPRRDG